VALQPNVAVRGAHFRPRERVRVTLTEGALRRTRFARVGAAGSFSAALGPLPTAFDPCSDAFSVVAVGGAGDRALVKYIGRECPPAP
jgi:hypothetical protein